MPPVHPLYKKRWCDFHWRKHGCSWGAACYYAHGIEEYKGPRDKWVEYYIKIGKAYNIYPQVPIPKVDALPRPDKLVTDVGASCGQASTEVAATTTDALDSTDAAAHTSDPLPEAVEKLATWQWLEKSSMRSVIACRGQQTRDQWTHAHCKEKAISDRYQRPMLTRAPL